MKILNKNGLNRLVTDTKQYVDSKTRVLTQAEYDALSEAEKNNGTVYFVPDAAGSDITASEVTFDNTGTSMTATNVQAAITELEAGGSGSDDSKMDKEDPTGTGSFSLNRKANTTIGEYSFTEGYNTTASGGTSHAEGVNTTASGDSSHVEGKDTTASGRMSHAEGYMTQASGYSSHVEGYLTRASGPYSHAEGHSTTASEISSHAEGHSTTASGDASHAEGSGTTANHRSQHVFGEFNVEDDSTEASTAKGNYVEIVGNGTGSSSRSNARTLDWDGNEVLAGSLTTTDVIKPTGSTWDGTNTSLATAISSLNSTLGNYLLIRTVNASIGMAYGNKTAVTAPSVSGYTFLTWIAAVSIGWVGNLYFENPTSSSSNVWSANYGSAVQGTSNIACYALYIKNIS